jgi:hypothetical protein
MVPDSACGCGCGGGKVAVTADVAVAVWQWQWMHSSGDCLAGSGSVVVLRVAVDGEWHCGQNGTMEVMWLWLIDSGSGWVAVWLWQRFFFN